MSNLKYKIVDLKCRILTRKFGEITAANLTNESAEYLLSIGYADIVIPINNLHPINEIADVQNSFKKKKLKHGVKKSDSKIN